MLFECNTHKRTSSGKLNLLKAGLIVLAHFKDGKKEVYLSDNKTHEGVSHNLDNDTFRVHQEGKKQRQATELEKEHFMKIVPKILSKTVPQHELAKGAFLGTVEAIGKSLEPASEEEKDAWNKLISLSKEKYGIK